jgi:hypothetical protein
MLASTAGAQDISGNSLSGFGVALVACLLSYDGWVQLSFVAGEIRKTHKTVAKWQSSCGEDGPHGLSVDQDAGYLFVACSTRAGVLDAGHDGKQLS